MEITGSTTVFAIAADPIAHVKTPQRLNALLRERGVDAVMVPFHVAPDALPGLFAGIRGLANLGGIVVTVPHKENAAALCDALTPSAQLSGAVNAVRLRDGVLTGGNFDGLGFVAGLRSQGHDPAGRHVYLAGLGGAGKAIACAVADAGPASLRLYNRSADKALSFAAHLSRQYPGLAISVASAAPQACDIAINATSLGLNDTDPLPFQLDALAAGTVVADAVMSRVDTPLLRAAAARGCRTHPGLYMLEGQIAEIARFLGIEEPRKPARALA
ncbi:shikimate dehydrogenase [Achromobacter sp. K91]|uniref:Shikimate dehydrogenase n=1 Tax=Achromobacter aegrifaciens TaxID=1287736 RepID=A0ABU2DCB1_ACHAE|nr:MULTISPECIES: shikimate dehydrogenase [Achromobacter]MBD9384958.1 shikimate dehydrogenase [Achromobacter sp. ACM02]MBD9422101.1 shikimate dehydrogenase [Achromobacter sp. ACM04]MDQ1759724.1 shikimate dehydrogenase [Achromobacter aegrifaciens]MDR7945726.1 shikimate dehydrogenase [Achromobacter aegrifaciens]RIJ03678.1 shikimate dehydrogenase [Achromobacter sp. K91]